MDRALDPELLRLALGQNSPQSLPSVEGLLELLTQAELALLLRHPGQQDALATIGWYLHGIATSKFALRTYGVERQRAAFQVAGHILDVVARTPDLSQMEKYKLGFAAQVAYLRSELSPNSLAIYNREFASDLEDVSFLDDFQMLSLTCGIAFLGFDVGYVFKNVRRVRSLVERLVNEWEVRSLFDTPLGASYGAIAGIGGLLGFLVYGNLESLARGRQLLRESINAEASLEDQISRWVAAHILNISDDLENSSIWTTLPPEVPGYVRKAIALGRPKVLTLWPPQLKLFRGNENPLSPDTRRLFLSTPTSGGKTLLAQLLIVSHLQATRTSVCYVAPTRSLCREIKRSLENRLKHVDAQIIADIPEWQERVTLGDGADVEVMTPERLSYLLRSDSEGTLSRFGLFVFDEVHLVGEKGRGWTLEESLTYINYATQHTGHKIALISAVIGNRNHFVQWITAQDKQPVHMHSDWRGPRRVLAVYSTDVHWNEGEAQTSRSKNYPHRVIYPQYGKLEVRISHTGTTHSLSTDEAVGHLAIRYTDKQASPGTGSKDKERSTAFYKMIVPIVEYLAVAGPVLVVESTRPSAVRMAKDIAEKRQTVENVDIQHILDLVEARLTTNHPLYGLLKRGVAYHHGSLPDEIKVAIEEAVTEGQIKILVATTTMTEGVNLPVRSVVIASQGVYYGVDDYLEYITGPKLINAIGRAGRATKETEGIVVLAWNDRATEDAIERLKPSDSEMQVLSMLAKQEALEALAAFEELQRSDEDALFEVQPNPVSDFLRFVWFVAAQLEELRRPLDSDTVNVVLNHTLGWKQIDDELRGRWAMVADDVVTQYRLANQQSRRRWAKSGTSLASARKLEQIAKDLSEVCRNGGVPNDPAEAIRIILADGRLEKLLPLPEFAERHVYDRRGGNRREIHISLSGILSDWVNGYSLVDLAGTYLAEVEDIEFRFEQLGDFVYTYFEVQFPWLMSTLITWVNEVQSEDGSACFSSEIPSYIRWGVNNPTAVELLNDGILSRRLALRIASQWTSVTGESDVYTWVRSMPLSEWQQRFNPSIAEVRSLLDYSRTRRGGASADLIKMESTRVQVTPIVSEYPSTEVEIRPLDGARFAPLAVFDGNKLVATINSCDQRDIQEVLSMGISLSIKFSASDGDGVLHLAILHLDS